MEFVSCNLCGSVNLLEKYSMPDRHYYPDEMFTVVECADCGLAFVNPRPDKLEIAKYYPKDFYVNFHEQEARYAAEIKFLRDFYTANDISWKGRMLDIGTANGDFPQKMQEEGWDVEGLEVSMNAEHGRNFPIYNCELPDIPVGDARYDLITSWAVFEHLHDPMAYFKKVGDILKPGGYFVFLVTNWDSVSSKYLMTEDVPRHLYFYSEKTTRRYLQLSGLRFINHETNDAIFSGSPENYIPWLVHRLLGKKFEWKDIPETRQEFLKRKSLRPSVFSNFKFLIRHPLVVLDRLLAPLIISYQVKTKTYSTSLYIAQKEK